MQLSKEKKIELSKAIYRDDAPKVQSICEENHLNLNETANSYGTTLAHTAVLNGAEKVIAYLAQKGADFTTALDCNGYSPVFNALRSQKLSPEYIETLAKNNIDLSVPCGKKNRKRTLAHSVIAEGALLKDGKAINVSILKALKDNGANMSAVDDAGNAPIHSLLLSPHTMRVDFLKILIDGKANVNAKDADGCTLLHHLMRARNPEFDNVTKEMVDLLVKAGADLSSKNNQGLTPKEVALKENCPIAAKTLDDCAALRMATMLKGKTSDRS